MVKSILSAEPWLKELEAAFVAGFPVPSTWQVCHTSKKVLFGGDVYLNSPEDFFKRQKATVVVSFRHDFSTGRRAGPGMILEVCRIGLGETRRYRVRIRR